MKRRAVLAGASSALLLGGCTDLLSGDEVTFEADTAVVPDQVQSETDYQEQRVEDMTIERDYDRVDRTVVVINRLAEYSNEVEIGPIGGELARFTVLSTPKVEVGPVGPLNPVDDMSEKELAQKLQQEYGSVQNVQEVDERDVSMLGETVSVTKFSAEAETQGGQNVDVFLHIGKVEHEDDIVLAIGVHPQELDEQENVDTLMGGIEHPVSTGSDAGENGTNDNSSA